MNTTQFIDQIVRENLWIRDIYTKHISENDELYDHYFMDEVSEVFLEIINGIFTSDMNSEEDLARIGKFLETIESGLQTNSDEIIRLILVGFIENITPEMEVFSFILEIMKNATREVIEYHYFLSATVPSVGNAAGWARRNK